MAIRLQLGEVLIKNGYINQEQLEKALEVQKNNPGKRLGSILVDLAFLTENEMLQCLSERLDIPYLDILSYPANREAVRLLTRDFAVSHGVAAIDFENDALKLATFDPLNMMLFDEISAMTGYELRLVLSPESDIYTAIDNYYSETEVASAVEDINRVFTDDSDDFFSTLGEKIEGAPVVKLINTIISQAYAKGASDIHLSPYEKNLEIRIRINGDLVHYSTMNIAAYNSILTRLKIMAGINIAEKRIPQDGKFSFAMTGSETSIRLSTMPTIYGEKVVLRLLDTSQNKHLLRLEALGMEEHELEIYSDMIDSPNGVILISGPTGAGKTSTLYATLNKLSQKKVNIVTIEDPVEKRLNNISQSQVNVTAGHTFATALRSILRQDPDIIMVGEMRDGETASIGIRAAITGHLVFSTLHTNDALSSVIRLVDMGVPRYLVAAAVTGVIAQRLVKILCPHCKKERELTQKERLIFGDTQIDKIYDPVGCTHCNFTGYSERIPVYEVIVIDATLRQMISEGATIAQMKAYTDSLGVKSLKDNVLKMAADGKTGADELKKIIFSVD